MSILKKIWKFVRWPLAILVIVYVVAVLANIPWPVSKARSDAAVAAIRAQRLTMKDADGSNLPPAPDPKKAAATIEGIDANNNGIRDDAEIAIFRKYPSQLKERAAVLQYARSLQVFITQVINTETWLEAAEKLSASESCIFDITFNNNSLRREMTDFARNIVLNTERRQKAESHSNGFEVSFTVSRAEKCEVEIE